MDRREDGERFDGEIRFDARPQSHFPSVQDPKLWMVKCVSGCARETAVGLMQKYTDKGAELQIRSAFKLAHIKNYIFVGADKKDHVREACKGFHNLDAQNITPVPIKGRAGFLSAGRKVPGLSGCRWVRMKTGTYKGDLARVVLVDHAREKITVKLIPRIDLQALANKLEGREVAEEKALLPPPRFMNVDEASELNIHVERRNGNCYAIIDGMIFEDGFLVKTVSINSISFQNIKPTSDELEKFRKPGKTDGNDVVESSEVSTVSLKLDDLVLLK
ncbi:putative transcription elongation factor SPT5 homolog 1 isoform X1 [Mercurialis annua]|uniref:putative transcription elongation factor SPT5 homolog 1 isoform X1 n=1 Tax=Mercurialis annua TaxID=3986 RepID=UPI0024AE0F53|nr:putative transcription elongation factor SPT5 homolog 1 isoform X1 [Mercurialis annua]